MTTDHDPPPLPKMEPAPHVEVDPPPVPPEETRYTDAEGNPLFPLKPGVSREGGEAVAPADLDEANQLLEQPWFNRPAGPWPVGAYVETTAGPIRWDDYSQRFVHADGASDPGAPPDDPLDITEQIFGPLPISPNLEHLYDQPYVGNQALTGTFQLGEYVILGDNTLAHYTRNLWFAGPAPEAREGTTSPTPHAEATYYLHPAFEAEDPADEPAPHSVAPFVRMPDTPTGPPDPSTYQTTSATPEFTRRYPTP